MIWATSLRFRSTRTFLASRSPCAASSRYFRSSTELKGRGKLPVDSCNEQSIPPRASHAICICDHLRVQPIPHSRSDFPEIRPVPDPFQPRTHPDMSDTFQDNVQKMPPVRAEQGAFGQISGFHQAVGHAIVRYRKVTTWARLQMRSMPNLPPPIPLVMPFSTAHSTAS